MIKLIPILLVISVLIISGCLTGGGNTTVTVASSEPSPTKTSDVSAAGCTAEEAALINCKYGCFLLQPETPPNYYLAQFNLTNPVAMCKQVCKEVRAIPGIESEGLDFTPNDKDVGNDTTPGVYISADGSYWNQPNSYNKDYAATGKSQDSGRIDDEDNSYATKYFCHEYKDQTGEPGLYTTVKGELPCKKYTDSRGELRPEIPYSGLCCKADDKGKNDCYDPFSENLAYKPGDHTGISFIYQHTEQTGGYFG